MRDVLLCLDSAVSKDSTWRGTVLGFTAQADGLRCGTLTRSQHKHTVSHQGTASGACFVARVQLELQS